MFRWWHRKPVEPVLLDFGAHIEFVGGQEGAGEARLTHSLKRLFGERSDVRRAYLTRVRYGADQPIDIALCLVGDESEALHDAICKLFWAMFEQGQHLDVIILRDDEEPRVRELSAPFYERT